MITKTAKTATQALEDNTALNSAAALAGAGLISNQYGQGNLTGRRTLYHGTTEQAKNGILEKGLLPTTEVSARNTNAIKYSYPETYQKALGKSYMTPSKIEAAEYGLGAKHINSLGTVTKNLSPQDVLTDAFFNKDKTIVKGNVPTWKMSTIRNPETAMGFEKWYETRSPDAKIMYPKSALKQLYANLDRAVAFDEAVPSQYLKGAKDYVKNSPKEILEYIRNNKLRAAKGLGVAGLGGLGLYYGGKNLVNKFTRDE